MTLDPFKFTTYRLFRATPPPEVSFIWGSKANGLMQEHSFVMLHASEKMGKSMFTLNFAVAGARCDAEFLGIPLRASGFRSLIVQSEVHMRAFYERLEQMIAKGELTDEQADRIGFNTERAVRLQGSNWGFLRRQIRKGKYDVVIVDPLAHLLVEDENSNAAVGKALTPLLRLRDDPGCAVLVVHHDSKFSEANAARPAHQRSRGANRLTADPDSIWSLSAMRRKGGPVAKFSCTARYGREMKAFRVRLNERSLWFEPYSQESEYNEDLVAFINEKFNGQIAEKPLIEELREHWQLNDKQHNDRTIRNRIKTALEAGVIRAFEVGGVTIIEIVKEAS